MIKNQIIVYSVNSGAADIAITIMGKVKFLLKNKELRFLKVFTLSLNKDPI